MSVWTNWTRRRDLQCGPGHSHHCGHHSGAVSAVLCCDLRHASDQTERLPKAALHVCTSRPGLHHSAGEPSLPVASKAPCCCNQIGSLKVTLPPHGILCCVVHSKLRLVGCLCSSCAPVDIKSRSFRTATCNTPCCAVHLCCVWWCTSAQVVQLLAVKC